MNKYQEILDKIKTMGDKDLYNERHVEWAETLQELVDKATSKKVINKHKEYFYYDEEQPFPASKTTGLCPVCKHNIEQNKYCPHCGQKIDWSGYNE